MGTETAQQAGADRLRLSDTVSVWNPFQTHAPISEPASRGPVIPDVRRRLIILSVCQDASEYYPILDSVFAVPSKVAGEQSGTEGTSFGVNRSGAGPIKPRIFGRWGFVRPRPGSPLWCGGCREQFEIDGQFRLVPEKVQDAWAHPVLLHGRLYVRYHDSLWCYDVRPNDKRDLRQ